MSRKYKNKRKQAKKNSSSILIVVGALFIVFSAIWLNNVRSPVLANEVDVHQAYQLRQEGAFILDVREQSEWDEKHIPGSTLIPLGELAGRVDELPKDQEIIVICRSGNRSQSGRDILLNAGFSNVTSVSGGVNSWIASGYDIVAGP
ncbi:MAG: rhodanese-like domain-containing protein [Chloroflexota bacterium]